MTKQLIRFDWAIKRLLRNKANFVVLEGFLSELLFDTIKIEQILESESNQETENDKFNRVDILTQNSKNEIIIIEIQSSYEIDFFHRMAYGVSKSITENLNIGQNYSEIKKVISINIVYFNLGQGQDYVYTGKTDFIGLHQNDKLGLTDKQKTTFLKNEISDIFPEYYLLKVNQFNDIAKDTLDEWIYFLKNSEVKDEFKAKGLKEAGEVLDIMRLPKDEEYGYNRYIDSLRLKSSEMFTLQTEAEFKVREENSISIAKNAINIGLSNELISTLTNLEIQKIKELRNKMKE
ncbi:MAG: Rpn family recombination-promoting nuclease/putative transposase [Sphingobacteriales bacterium]|jgi:predicted transposase/invertase (TIGR01784 family)|nr:MAG: Rpn family recombination-promoting nuclease/putative transposase [Sphingobacteriales bacterium]TAF46692.1 MAG: Rpn family recombination-promoting nuclease/putative transposase [Sphingobacteriales bacterium]